MKMKWIIGMMMFASVSLTAQTDPKTPVQDKPPMPANDTTSVNTQVQKESDLKTMDAVKTQDHPKVTPKKDSTATRKDKRSSNRRTRP